MKRITQPGEFKSNGHKGGWAEMAACCWLLSQGFEVFRNVAQHGPADIIAWRRGSGQLHLFDAKSVSEPNKPGYRQYHASARPSEFQKDCGVELLYVYPDGQVSKLNPIDPGGRLNPLDPKRDWLIL